MLRQSVFDPGYGKLGHEKRYDIDMGSLVQFRLV